MKFQIVSSMGVDLGIYEGETAEEAVRAMNRDAGYKTDADVLAVTGETDILDGLEVTEVVEVPVLEAGRLQTDTYENPDLYENLKNEAAVPTSRCLSGSDDYWAAEEWSEPVITPDGRAATKYYLFAKEDITCDDGEPLDAEHYPWDAEHVSKIVINDNQEIKFFVFNDQRFGNPGIIETVSAEIILAGMMPSLKEWAEEKNIDIELMIEDFMKQLIETDSNGNPL